MQEIIFGTLASQQSRATRLRESVQGVQHQSRLEPLAPGPGESVTLTVTIEVGRRIESVECVVLSPNSVGYQFELVTTEWDLLNWSYYQVWQVSLPPQPEGTLVRYRINAYPAGDRQPIPSDGGAIFSYVVGKAEEPHWAAKAIVYQVFPDRFHPGSGATWNKVERVDNIYGGTLRGITENLSYIADLGFNCIWLNPFFPDKTHHGYHATDYFAVNPRLGTLEELQALINQGQARGIRFLLDFVANHWGSEHPTFQEALKDRNSQYYDWYHWIDWPHEYQTFFGVRDLPKLNVDNPEVRNHLLQAATYWLGEIGFDGLRLDFAHGASHNFWAELRAAVDKVKADIWLIGEVVEPPTTQLSYFGRMHGCLDFTLQQALRNTFAHGDMSLTEFDAFLSQHEAFFPAGFSRPSFLDNHDINRFLWLVDGDKRRLKLAALCHFTLIGQPIVYYGTEVGLSQERDIAHPVDSQGMSEARLPMLWGQEQDGDLRDFYRWLIHFRRRHPVLWHGRRWTKHLNQEKGTYGYVRADEDETIVVALNLSDEKRHFEVAGQSFELARWSGDAKVVNEIPTTP